ncbi:MULTISPECIES: signal peptidase I [Clostridium]|uniref:signal peptidase I n=1 Tax=Clostridium TaxID=1485 RepID=UPI001EEF6A62|nr:MULTISPECIES: signal peptidase I [Clostridium]WRY51598.1 signal peptidase I [Clostridium intestinale]
MQENINEDNVSEVKDVEENIKEEETKKVSGMKGFLFDWILPVVLALIATLIINKFLLFKVYIPSESMKPTLEKGDQLFVTKVYNLEKLQRGDIIVFYSNELGDTLIKRLIALPNDKVEIKEGKVYINGDETSEEYVKNPSIYNGSFTVPEGKYFFLGDNRANSADARYWANPYIDGHEIKGKAQVRVFPFNRVGMLK